MKVDRISESDLPDLARLYCQFRGEEASLQKMRQTFRRIRRNTGYILLGVREQGRLVGSAMGVLCEELYGSCRPFMVVEDVIVDREHRRRGIGAQLMRELERMASRRGCSYVMLVTDAFRSEALDFYEALGYHPQRYRACKKYLASAAGHVEGQR